MFLAAKEDYEGGYIFNLKAALTGEIFSDFIAAAQAALDDGYKDVAAVLACAALEDTLKRLAGMHGATQVSDMSQAINYLKSQSVLSGGEKRIIETLPDTRNAALHADWGNVSDFQVRTVISAVEPLIAKHF